MGKSITDTGDPFLLGLDKAKPKNGKEVPKKVTQSVEVEEDPFLLGVKKKESETVSEGGGTPSPTGTENIAPSTSPLPLEQKESRFKIKNLFAQSEGQTIFDKSFLDRDIDRRSEIDLTNPALTKSTNKYSLRNLYADPAQKRFDEEKELEKINIKSTPESLAAYSKTRLDEINADIQDGESKKWVLRKPVQSLAEARAISDQTNEIDTSIAEAQLYRNKFKNSVALQAAKTIVPKYVNPDTPFDPKQIGRDIMKVADPDFDLLMQEAETGGASLPGVTKANLEKVGIDLSKDYLQSLPVTPATQQKLKEVEEYEKTFDERNFELTAQRAKEKLGAYFYDKGKSGFWGYSGRNIESAINDPEAGLTDTEKKIALDYVLPTEKRLFFSTDIPGSGLFRSAKNAIEKSVVNTGNTVAGWIGDRGDPERAFEVLNEEVGGSQFRAPGENPNLKSELANLTRKENKEKLSKEEQARKVELEKYVDVRSGWSKFVDGTGDLTGQVAEIALLTKGIGLGGRALMALGESGGIVSGLTTSALGTTLSNETVGLFLSSYLNSYDGYRQQALQTMPGKENAANRDAYAKTMAAMEGLSERLFNDTKILKAFTKNIAPSISDITSRFINKEITQQLAKEELQKTLAQQLKPYAKEFGKSIVQESTEEAVVDIADGMAQSIFGGQPFDLVETGKKAVNTFLTTALYSGLIGGMAAKGQVSQNKSQNSFMKSAIVDMANSPMPYLQSVEELRMSGQITQPEANEKIKLIKSASNYLKEIPESVTVSKKVDGQNVISQKQLDYPEASAYLIHRMNEGIINDQLEKTTDEVLKSQLEQQLKRSIEIRKGIIDNTIGVTPNLEEVAADEKKANDLNVLDAEKLPGDELIGTPFEPMTDVSFKKPEQIEVELKEQLGEEKSNAAISQVKEFVDNDLIPETVSPEDKNLAENTPLQFLQFVAEQAQSEIELDGKKIQNREKATEYFGEGIVAAAEDFFPPKIEPVSMETTTEGQKEGVVPTTLEEGGQTIETDNAAMDGSYGDKIEISGEEVMLPKKGFFITDVSLKEGKEKGKGSGQEIYLKALNQFGRLYSMHPVSEDALRVQEALEGKELVTIKLEDIGGNEIRVIDLVAKQQSFPTGKQKVRVTAEELESAQPKQKETIKTTTDAKEKTTPTKQPENAPKGEQGADNESKQAAKTETPKPKQKEVSKKVKSLTDELRALLGNEAAALTGDANPKNRMSFKDLGITDTDTIEQAIDKLIAYGGDFTNIFKAIKADANFKNVKLQLVDSRSGLENGESGLYYPVGYGEGMDNTLQIANKDNVYYTAAHELLHFLTLDGATANELKNTPSYQALTDMYNYIADKKGKPVAIAGGATVESYGLTNEKEFMAELLINPTFRKYVSDVFAENKDDIFKASKSVRDSKVNSIGDIIFNLFRDLFNKIFSSKQSDIPFDEKQSVVDNAARLATQLFFGGENVIVGQTDSGQGATVLGMGSQDQRTAALALPGTNNDEKINSFVKAALERGESEADVKEALINNGISEEDAQAFIDGNKPPTETEETETDGEPGKERRQFSEQVLADKKILKNVKRGVQNAIEYTRQTNRMSVEEAEEILKRVGIDEAYNLVTLVDELKPAVRVVLGQSVIKAYNQLAKEAKGSNLENYYIDKTIDVANYVSEKLGTEAGQMIQAFSLWSRLTPEAQLRSAAKEAREQGKKKVAKVKNDINDLGDKLQQANEEAADELVKSKKKKSSVEKAESQHVKKAKDKIQAAKDKRNKLIEQRKKDKGKGGSLYSSVGGLTPEGIEFVGNVAATYIQEGAARVEVIVQKISEHLKDVSGKDLTDEVRRNVTDIVTELVTKQQNRNIAKGLAEMESEVGRIVKEHYTVPEESKTSLVNKFMDSLDLDKTDAETLAKEIQAEFENIVKRKKDDILFNEKRRFDRIQKGLTIKKDNKTVADDIIKYSNLGAFDNSEFTEFLEKKFEVGKLSPEDAKKINQLSEKIQKAPEGSPKNDATQELLAHRANMKGISWLETLQAVWYANILSGYATHLRNVVSTFFNGMGYFGAEAARDPKSIPVLIYGSARGVNRGIREAWHTISTGKSPIHISKVETPGTLERQQFRGGYFNPYNWLKFVGRLMVAEDVLQFQALKEMRATQLAYREAKKIGSKNPFSKATWKIIDEKLLNTKERTEAAFAQAKEEGYTEKSVERKRRVYELMENSRPIQMTEDAYGFAARGTFNFEPEGTLGAITNAVSHALNFEVSGARPIRFLVPFTRIITNVVNTALDFGPVGLARAARGGSLLTGSKYRQLTPEEKKQLIARASLGMAMTGAIYALTKVPCKDGHNVLDITGAGTGDYKKDAQLKETGWQPYSIRVCGGSYFSYKFTPLVFNLGFLGYMNDREKYNTKEESDFTGIMGALYQTGQLALDGTWVGSTSDIMKTMSESSPSQLAKNLQKTVENMGLQAALPNAYVQGAQVTEEWLNLPKKEAKTFYERLIQHIPIARNSLNNKINTLGEDIITDVDIFKSERKPHKVYDFLIKKNQWVAPVNKNSVIVMDEETGIERPATDDEYYKFSKRRGELIKQKTETLMDDGVTETTAEGEQEISAEDLNAKQMSRIMRRIKTEASKQAKLELFSPEEKKPKEKYKLEINEDEE